MTRTHSYCGMRGHAPFAKCPMFIQCFETNNNMNDWETCMENEVRRRVLFVTSIPSPPSVRFLRMLHHRDFYGTLAHR